MPDEKFAALVAKAKEIDAKVREAKKEMEDLKTMLASFKSAGGGKKKGFWDNLLGDDDEAKEGENE